MKYRVRSSEGELEYLSFGQVEQAWLMGLIAPEDEILEEGHTKWRKAKTIPLLMQARRSGEQVWMGTWFVWTLLGVAGATIALVLFRNDETLAGALVSIVVALVMMKVTTDANRRSRPH